MNKLLLAVLVALSVSQPDGAALLQEARALFRAGNLPGSAEAFKRAVEGTAPGSVERATALLNLAEVELRLGRYADVARHGREAATAFGPLGETRRISQALNFAGLAHLYAGEYVQARTSFTAAIEVSRRGGHQEHLAEQLANLGNVHYFSGAYADAERLYEEALAITGEQREQPWAGRRRRVVLANQATLQLRLGHYSRALDLYRELENEPGGLPDDEQGQLLVSLGVLYRRLGDPVKALATYDRARELFARRHHADGEIGALKNRGIVQALDLRDLEAAERTFSETIGQAQRAGNRRELLHATLYRGETRLRAGRRPEAREDFTAGLTLSRELRTPEEEWKALFGLGRVADDQAAATSHFSESIATIERIREGIRLPSLRSDFLNDKREVYDALIGARLASASPSELFGLVERSHSRGWRDLLGLAGGVELAAIQAALPAETLLLDYWSAPQGSAVVAVRRSRAAVVPVSVDGVEIGALLDDLARGGSSSWRERFSKLAAELLPSGDWFDGVAHVVVVPDAALAMVPFELLPVGDRMIVEFAATAYTPSAATLLRERPRVSGLRAPWRLQLQAFADPLISATADDDRSTPRERLTASAQEVQRAASELAGTSILHVGPDNRKAYLAVAAERAPILHLATHAIADLNAMEQSRIVFSPAAGSSAGADYLFLREAYDLPLKGVELAVLSACDTERGTITPAEGVRSFSRAFLAAGARTTVTTLWRVADGPTAEFMTLFYHHLQAGAPRDEALRLAKLRFLQSGTDLASPDIWAAFVLTGDGAEPIPRALPWSRVAAAPTVVLLSVVGIIVLRRHRRRLDRHRIQTSAVLPD